MDKSNLFVKYEGLQDYYKNNGLDMKEEIHPIVLDILDPFGTREKEKDIPYITGGTPTKPTVKLETPKVKGINMFTNYNVPMYAPVKEKVNKAIDFFIEKGLTKEQSAGIVGNLYAESGMNTKIPGDKGTSYGLAQWHNERWKNLQNFTKSKGLPEDSFDGQLEFLWHELNTSENKSLNRLKTATNPTEAARIFANSFERMKKYETKREKNANDFYNTHNK